MVTENGFARVHGHADYSRASDLVGEDLRRLNLFIILETTRVVEAIRRRWPGARKLVNFGLETEFHLGPPRGDAEKLLRDVTTGSDASAASALREAATRSINCFDTVSRLDEPWVQEVLAAYPNLPDTSPRPMSFISDLQFPVTISTPPSESLVADMKDQAQRAGEATEDQDVNTHELDADAADADASEQDETDSGKIAAAYLYDEWDFQQNEYRRDWCKLHEVPVQPADAATIPGGWREEVDRVRAVFERLKPEVVRKEKYLPEGEAINLDLLLEHQVQKRREPAPRVRFYEKPLVQRRDLAVLILMDLSGSTGEQLEGRDKVLDLEKRAAVTLGEGLTALDDTFAVAGFSSNGPEQCEYFVFKRFADDWSAEARAKVFAAWPRNSTRIGPALRHAGWLLGQEPHRQKLVLLVTDGKPMDQGYDPNTRYAQHDVRMACEENARMDVHTFAISTRENSEADMEIMFPRRRFVILHDLHELPRVLPQLYLKLTL
jgi:nitric oxide reductase activation protein